MARIIVHWTAGTHKASASDREHYHVLVEGDGRIVYGKHPIDANAKPAREPRASHTKNLNTGSIGVAVCCMKGAKDKPFSSGPFPMTTQQWQVAAEAVAELCARYRIAVTARTVLAHGEVQDTLGVAQLEKWDPMVLPWTPSTPPSHVMEQFRALVETYLEAITAPVSTPVTGPGTPVAPPPPPP